MLLPLAPGRRFGAFGAESGWAVPALGAQKARRSFSRLVMAIPKQKGVRFAKQGPFKFQKGNRLPGPMSSRIEPQPVDVLTCRLFQRRFSIGWPLLNSKKDWTFGARGGVFQASSRRLPWTPPPWTTSRPGCSGQTIAGHRSVSHALCSGHRILTCKSSACLTPTNRRSRVAFQT